MFCLKFVYRDVNAQASAKGIAVSCPRLRSSFLSAAEPTVGQASLDVFCEIRCRKFYQLETGLFVSAPAPSAKLPVENAPFRHERLGHDRERFQKWSSQVFDAKNGSPLRRLLARHALSE